MFAAPDFPNLLCREALGDEVRFVFLFLLNRHEQLHAHSISVCRHDAEWCRFSLHEQRLDRILSQVSARGYVVNWAVVAGVRISASKVAVGRMCVGWSCFGAAALQPRVQLDFWTLGVGAVSSSLPQCQCRAIAALHCDRSH